MGRDQDRSEQFEWVNAWAESAKGSAAPTTEPVADVATATVATMPAPIIAPIAHTLPPDQLMRDIAEIERVRDALAALPLAGHPFRRRVQAMTLVPSRTTDAVPVVVGGVLALVMLTVFGAAAAMTKLAR
jgi:hypothetical protein